MGYRSWKEEKRGTKEGLINHSTLQDSVGPAVREKELMKRITYWMNEEREHKMVLLRENATKPGTLMLEGKGTINFCAREKKNGLSPKAYRPELSHGERDAPFHFPKNLHHPKGREREELPS